jgi:hypothetical protein
VGSSSRAWSAVQGGFPEVGSAVIAEDVPANVADLRWALLP